jgi:3-hydroxybutyryl-CoA dehydrogenase
MIQKIAVIGAGQMGNGIAHVFALNNYQVTLIDVSEDALNKALATIAKNNDRMLGKGTITAEQVENCKKNIVISTSIADGVKQVELVIEAATENVDLKLKIFKDIDANAPENCILATNTSSISITKIAAATKRPASVIGMHFMNPVPVMKLVEIIDGYSTSKEVSNTIVEITKGLGKVPVVVNDYAGFVSNRILMPMINEAIETLFQGVGGVAEIDTVMKLGMAHPMGPLQLADFIGLDTCLAILRVIQDGFGNPKYAPCPLLVNMVAAGKLGVKSGEGFYVYTAGSKDLVVSNQFK